VIAPQPPASAERIRLVVTPGPLAGPLVSRVVGIAASRADLPVDRLNDALLVADAIAAHAPAQLDGSADDKLEVSVRASEGRLEVRVGPLRPGGAKRLLGDSALPAIGNVIARLATRARVAEGAGGDTLVIDVEAT
jgi:serine/threonine-protein kinase RsbW